MFSGQMCFIGVAKNGAEVSKNDNGIKSRVTVEMFGGAWLLEDLDAFIKETFERMRNGEGDKAMFSLNIKALVGVGEINAKRLQASRRPMEEVEEDSFIAADLVDEKWLFAANGMSLSLTRATKLVEEKYDVSIRLTMIINTFSKDNNLAALNFPWLPTLGQKLCYRFERVQQELTVIK